jgi:hypothetical protein
MNHVKRTEDIALVGVGDMSFVVEYMVLDSDELGQGPDYTHSSHPDSHTAAPKNGSGVLVVESHWRVNVERGERMEGYVQAVMRYVSDSYFRWSEVD